MSFLYVKLEDIYECILIPGNLKNVCKVNVRVRIINVSVVQLAKGH